MPQILFLARRFESYNIVRDEKRLDVRDELVADRYEEIRCELATYGTVLRYRTSGIYPSCVLSPLTESENESPKTLIENPAEHPSSLEASRRLQQSLFTALENAGCIVAVIDGESDTRGSLIERASAKRKPVLLLQPESSMFQADLRPLYQNREQDGILFRPFKTTDEMKRILSLFFQRFPALEVG